MGRFKIGDIVRIGKKAKLLDAGNPERYPRNEDGVVIRILAEDDYPIGVRFDSVSYPTERSLSDFSETEIKLVRRE